MARKLKITENELYGFLQSGDSLNPLLASFFSKVMGILINRKTDQARWTPRMDWAALRYEWCDLPLSMASPYR